MIEKPIGLRVYAVSESNERTVFLVGFGTYQGEKPIYGQLRPSNLDMRKAERQLRKHDEEPIDVAAVLRAKRSHLKTNEEIERAVHEYERKYYLEKQRPMEDRVRDHLAKRESKPCIYLDSGVIVWGHEVLWGPEDKWERYRRDREVVNVNVSSPYDAQRWKEEETRDGRTGSTTDRQTHEQGRTARPTRSGLRPYSG